MFSPISWQWYLRSTQNNLQSAKNRTANAVKHVSKLANDRFRMFLRRGTFERLKITSKELKIEEQML